jgi:hypothetical protein
VTLTALVVTLAVLLVKVVTVVKAIPSVEVDRVTPAC